MASVDIILGLGFGDEGKGATVDALARRTGSRICVRFNGGGQAAHHVTEDSGRHHCFSQWGSGTFAGAATFLSRFMMVNPVTAMKEASHLVELGVSDPLSLLHIELEAPITTPFHMAANRCKELLRLLKGEILHGSCGMGIGETMADIVADEPDVLRMWDLPSPNLRNKLRAIQARKLQEIVRLDERGLLMAHERDSEFSLLVDHSVVDETDRIYTHFWKKVTRVNHDWLTKQLAKDQHILFEGAQGVLLDQDHGFQPHTTWSDCTYRNAHELLHKHRGPVRRLGVLRAFHTRHGAGPFPTERAEFLPRVSDDHNGMGRWQGSFRAGAFDLMLAKYALHVAPECDELVFTHMDKIRPGEEVPVCTRYAEMGLVPSMAQIPSLMAAGATPLYEDVTVPNDPNGPQSYAHWLAEHLGRPLALTSYGPKASDRRDP